MTKTMGRVPIKELHFSFSRSSGAGGQNINKVNSKASMKWNFSKTEMLSAAARERFLQKYKHFIFADDEDQVVVLHSQRFRTQGRNIADCIEKLHEMIESIWVNPLVRKKSKPSATAINKRIKIKKGRAETKKTRQKISHERF